MARMYWGAVAVAPSGRLGAVVFMPRSNAGPTVDTRTLLPAQDINQPETAPQQRMRSFLTAIVGLWSTLSTPQKIYWNVGGMRKALSGFNRFCKYNLLQVMEGYGPQITKNVDHLDTPTAPSIITGFVDPSLPNTIQVTWLDAAGANAFTAICASDTTGFVATAANAIIVRPATDGDPQQATIFLAAGTYFLNGLSFGIDGGHGADSTQAGPYVVTQGPSIPPKRS